MQSDVVRLVGPERAVEILGIRLVGLNADNGKKFQFTVLFVALVFLLERLLQTLAPAFRDRQLERSAFWVRQGIHLATAVVADAGLVRPPGANEAYFPALLNIAAIA